MVNGNGSLALQQDPDPRVKRKCACKAKASVQRNLDSFSNKFMHSLFPWDYSTHLYLEIE